MNAQAGLTGERFDFQRGNALQTQGGRFRPAGLGN